ncbi:hypothetical protein C7444_1351 [Sphaerotilus hippei]|uniref:Uncharacterized protein n=1 Tax=Sphaerotilus hippei TaxID=744406 RepID=A0A318GY33_9BURK|nr:hypothetical protein [Sphaerotilus hippei]PXW91546.1 hypothetical protein C7444_1351 [Sphaerotilus hippei]
MSRQSRYEDFEKFTNDAEARFTELRDTDERAKNFSDFYSFYAVKGGAMGGIDKRVFEVFFGNRPIDHVQTFESQGGQFPLKQDQLLAERGATLRYERTDVGTIVCTLFPAKTKNLCQREDSIVLDWITYPKALHSRRTLEGHWRSFISYMECTSVDGEPRALDKMRVGHLRFTRLLVIDGRVAKRNVVEAVEKIVGYVLTIGLSGFLLTLINMVGASGETEKVKAESAAVPLQLSEASGIIHAQNERIISLERRIDTIQTAIAEWPNPQGDCMKLLPEIGATRASF